MPGQPKDPHLEQPLVGSPRAQDGENDSGRIIRINAPYVPKEYHFKTNKVVTYV